MITAEISTANSLLVDVTRSSSVRDGAWARLSEAYQRGVVGGAGGRIVVGLDVFLTELEVLREVRRTFETGIELGPRLRERLQLTAVDRKRREAAVTTSPRPFSEILPYLQAAGFRRTLRPFQATNLGRILALPHAADFSVPGAGKTTVALANYAFHKSTGMVERALIVAPIPAFATWKEEVEECFTVPPKLCMHGVGLTPPHDVEILVTNYHRLASDYVSLRKWVASKPTLVILDEAHRIKRGRDGVHGMAALDLAFCATRRDILTGTPTPQGAIDLVALIEYLYPGQARQILPQESFIPQMALDDRVMAATHQATRRYFVRTCKQDLSLPPTTWQKVARDMGPVQEAIYRALVGTYRGLFELPTQDRRTIRQLGKVVMYLLEASTNPLLLTAGSDEWDSSPFLHPPLELKNNEPLVRLLQNYAQYERPWKYDYLMELAGQNAAAGMKTLIWSSFVRNIRLLSQELSMFNPAVIHGGVRLQDSLPTGSSECSREGELERFRHDPRCSVLLANPAACGEGISLHHWCHHAVYLDRTFNAGHFLQSQDRIHRLGLADGTITKFTLLLSKNSIDESVDDRVGKKVRALARLMDDPGLVNVALPSEEDTAEEDGFEFEDARSLESHLRAYKIEA